MRHDNTAALNAAWEAWGTELGLTLTRQAVEEWLFEIVMEATP